MNEESNVIVDTLHYTANMAGMFAIWFIIIIMTVVDQRVSWLRHRVTEGSIEVVRGGKEERVFLDNQMSWLTLVDRPITSGQLVIHSCDQWSSRSWRATSKMGKRERERKACVVGVLYSFHYFSFLVFPPFPFFLSSRLCNYIREQLCSMRVDETKKDERTKDREDGEGTIFLRVTNWPRTSEGATVLTDQRAICFLFPPRKKRCAFECDCSNWGAAWNVSGSTWWSLSDSVPTTTWMPRISSWIKVSNTFPSHFTTFH